MLFRSDSADKTRSRVFLMARQYSQKIKKANQLLKVKSPELEHTPGSQPQKPAPKDLAAILEEKRQGGPAIGRSQTAFLLPRTGREPCSGSKCP